MNIKKNDKVLVLTGKDKGKSGQVMRALPKLSQVIVEGVNVKQVHLKAKKRGEKGERVSQSYPIHVSNVKKVTTK